jgi:glycosyltransferase involved in cell wall biosynthesis
VDGLTAMRAPDIAVFVGFGFGADMLDASVIICANNPRPDYLRRVLDALRQQSLSPDKWELLIVDNASNEPLASSCDITWHPNGRHILESELGLAPARRRGMREARTELLVFVDDDNVLAENYLSEAIGVSRNWPVLGVWGSGYIRPEFELEPPAHLTKFLHHLALRDLPAARWSNVSTCFDALPIGAGMCVRANVAAAYQRSCEQSTIRIMDRQGKSLSSGGDDEICFVACKEGFGMGVFPELRMTHLIPRERISEKFFVNLIEGNTTADFLLAYKWRGISPSFSSAARTLLYCLRSIVKDDRVERRMHVARIRGFLHAKKIINTYHHNRASWEIYQ